MDATGNMTTHIELTRSRNRTASSLSSEQTPRLILDRSIMMANIERMNERCRKLGIGLRPHLKTPKSIPIAQALLDHGAVGVTVSTLKEAEYFFASGVADIFYAVPIDGGKIARAAALLRAGCNLSLLTDSLLAARQVAERASEEKVVLPVWIEIDVDNYRTGVDPASDEFSQLATTLAKGPWTRLAGIMSYGGASYGCATPDEAADLAERHRIALLETADKVEALGIRRPKLSFGSTPAVLRARSLEGIDEARCGIYVFQDLFQAGIGACAVSDIALSVLATVVGHNPALNRFTVDAGALAMSKDRSTQGHAFDASFGLVCDAETGGPIGDLLLATVSQELGLVTSPSGVPLDFDRFPIGSKVRILPNHADMTAAAYEDYLVIGGIENEIWTRQNRWD